LIDQFVWFLQHHLPHKQIIVSLHIGSDRYWGRLEPCNMAEKGKITKKNPLHFTIWWKKTNMADGTNIIIQNFVNDSNCNKCTKLTLSSHCSISELAENHARKGRWWSHSDKPEYKKQLLNQTSYMFKISYSIDELAGFVLKMWSQTKLQDTNIMPYFLIFSVQ
jgi:hypothetical protein